MPTLTSDIYIFLQPDVRFTNKPLYALSVTVSSKRKHRGTSCQGMEFTQSMYGH